jgi:hypothetical protein
MAGTLVIGPEGLQSWWLPGDEARKNGWAQRYEDELTRLPSTRGTGIRSGIDKGGDIEQRPLIDSDSEGGREMDEKIGHADHDRDVSFHFPLGCLRSVEFDADRRGRHRSSNLYSPGGSGGLYGDCWFESAVTVDGDQEC